ncbi:extracellular solute-binding protein [Paenibacillus flagellatus]|nr:extracellular solute-binding protein [Paenibacillus flagellatus]
MSDQPSRKTFRARLDHMTATLRGDIVTGKLRPGDFLPSERDMTKQFRLSNKLVRAALERLVEEGLIEKIPRVGNRIADRLPDLAVTLKFGYHASLARDAELARLLDDFHLAHPSIRVQPIPIAFDHYAETVDSYIENGLLDVVSMNYNNFYEFRARGRLDLLQPLAADEGAYPFLNDAFTFEGKQYVRPFVFSPLVLCYNIDHLEEAGLPVPYRPDGWRTLLGDASRLTVENERFGFYFFLHSKNRWPVFVLQSGLGEDAAASASDDPERFAARITEGLNLCREIIYAPNAFPTFLSGSDADAEELFAQRKVSIIMTSYLSLNALRESDIRYDVVPLPVWREDATILMAIGLAVGARSEAKAAATAFVEFMTSERAQQALRSHTLSIPAHARAAEREGAETMYRPPGYRRFKEMIPSMRLFTDMNVSPDKMNAIMNEAKLYWAKLQSETGMRRKIADLLRGG